MLIGADQCSQVEALSALVEEQAQNAAETAALKQARNLQTPQLRAP